MKKGLMYKVLGYVYKWIAECYLSVFPVNKSRNSTTTTACFVLLNLGELKPVRTKDYSGKWIYNETFQVGDSDYYVDFSYDWMYFLYYTKDISNIGNCYNIGGVSLKCKYDPLFAIELSKRVQDWYIERYGEKG